MAVRVFDLTGSASYTTITLGVDYAVQHNADVINMSLGFEILPGFRKLLFCVIAACTGMVVGYQLSRVLFANVRLCLGIGAVCAVILGILAFRFYRAGLFLVCAVLMFFVIKTLLHREDWWVYPVSSLAALAAGYSVFLLEKPAENISETSDVREEKGKDKREKKSHRKREADEQKERHARRRQERS